ncbi:GntR family transcriptional regulator [Roseitranquillus sediminis]|uniref:GntR family transcriptional regulator n=1 Tax=Roseitranquillus sediminis TaxID=2809051 RepID=UPI001D0C4702|nr:GntR family transcriptional regulator [Roseitranquillus sediminis]MBM9593237.1 FCD domain-containing protein [Roseitranquillus sediminis]
MDVRRADAIADELEQLILTGSFEDGERLDEARLAARFGVSRTPVREALHKLGTSGLVEQMPRRGVFVRLPGAVDLMEMFELMAELEGACGRLAASRITAAGLASLRDASKACARAAEAGDPDAYFSENQRFHQLIYRHAANRYLEAEALRMQKRLKAYRRLQLHLRGRMDQSLDEHRAILRALEAGESETAAAALRAHVAVQGEKFQRLRATLGR